MYRRRRGLSVVSSSEWIIIHHHRYNAQQPLSCSSCKPQETYSLERSERFRACDLHSSRQQRTPLRTSLPTTLDPSRRSQRASSSDTYTYCNSANSCNSLNDLLFQPSKNQQNYRCRLKNARTSSLWKKKYTKDRAKPCFLHDCPYHKTQNRFTVVPKTTSHGIQTLKKT